MKRPAVFSLFVLVVVCCSRGWCSADIYKFVDENGVVHLTNMPTHNRYRLVLKEDTGSFYREQKYDSTIAKLCARYDVEIPLVKAVIKTESNFDPYAVSKKGAQGLMQLMPAKARELGIADPFNPRENLKGGIQYLRALLDRFRGNLDLALAAYNAGEQAVVERNGVPPYAETRNYIKKVRKYKQYYQ